MPEPWRRMKDRVWTSPTPHMRGEVTLQRQAGACVQRGTNTRWEGKVTDPPVFGEMAEHMEQRKERQGGEKG